MVGRDADRQYVPAPMRRDVRLLGDLLGEVLRESGGQDLLDDVERLRHAVIAARHREAPPGEAGRPAGDPSREIGEMVAAWPLDRAEAVAHAFTVYFHLANLAEEHQRIRTLRERDTGDEPVRESLAEAVAGIRAAHGSGRVTGLVADLRVHPVLTAHPTEARRRAVTEALRRISALLARLDDERLGASERAEARRRLREEIDLLWRTSALRAAAMQPLDEVRAAMTAFDETLFRVVPALYRSLDRALAGPASGRAAAAAPPFLRFGSWIGADRDGNPFVTAEVTKQTAAIQAEHVLRALENATERIGRALTVHAGGPSRHRAWPGRSRPPGARTRNCSPRSWPARRRNRSGRTSVRGAAAARDPAGGRLARTGRARTRRRARSPAWPTRARRSSSPTCAWCSGSWPQAGAARQAFGELQHLLWQAETFGFHLAELEIRQHSAVHARALRELAPAGSPERACRRRPARSSRRSRPWPGSRTGSARMPAGVTWSASPGPRRMSRPSTSWPGAPSRTGAFPSSTSSRCSRAGRTWRTRPGCSTTCCAWSRWRRGWRPPGGAWRSCSATPTRPRNSARSARPCGCSTRSSG